ncbi:LamG domain-containing protein, partial [Patescibacteria group bacterium]
MRKVLRPKKNRVLLRIGLITIAILLPLAGIYTYKALTAKGAWSAAHRAWAKRKNVTVTNNSTDSLAASTTVAITVDTKAMYDTSDIQDDCDDLRVLYSTDGQAWTELDRYVSFPGSTTCATSTATKVYFPLQAALASAAESDDYYIYYSNGSASSPSSTIDTFDTSSANALLVCPFDGDTDCVNSSGLEQPTTESGAIRYSGSKTAMEFDGVNDYLEKSDNNTLDISDTLTLEAWVRADSFEQNSPYIDGIIDKERSECNYTLRLGDAGESPGEPQFMVCESSTEYKVAANEVISTNEWTHIAGTYDGNDLKIYINGILKNTNNIGPKTLNNDSSSLRIGYDYDGRYFNGSIDEVRISNIVRYAQNFTPQTTPFVRDPYTKLLLHFDEGGDDPRNTGKAIDDSGNGNHGTITGAKYVAGLVGVDNGTTDGGYQYGQSYAGHEGVFIEEGTTNLIKNPSFDHSTFNTLWSDEEDDSTVFNLATASATFTPNMAKRNAPGPFTTAPIIQGDWGGSDQSGDLLNYPRGSQISGGFYANFDEGQGSVVFWYTPEFDSSSSTGTYGLFATNGGSAGVELSYLANTEEFLLEAGNQSTTKGQALTAGTTYLITARWDEKNTLDGTNYLSISVNDSHTLGASSTINVTSTLSDIYVGWGWSGGSGDADGIIEGLTVYRRPLWDGTYGIDVGNGDEIAQIYDATPANATDPTLITGSWDVVFALPTDQSLGTLGTTGQAWSHPHSSNLLNNGFFMEDPAFNGWELEGTPSATGSASTTDKVFAGGGYVTSDAANEGIYQDITVSAGDDFVVRAIAHSDDTCVPRVILYDQSNTAEIGHLDGATDDDRTDPATLIFTGEAPSGCTNLRVKLVNTASSGTCYWHQVEVLDNLITNPSMESWQGTTPDVPTSWTNENMESGDSDKETTIVHSGTYSFELNNAGDSSENEGIMIDPLFTSTQ